MEYGSIRRGLHATLCVAWIAGAGAAPLGCNTLQGAQLYQQGTDALDRGETERAVRVLEQAAQRVPEASEIQNHLGLAYLAAGRRDDARRAFERAVALDCDNDAAQHNLRWVGVAADAR